MDFLIIDDDKTFRDATCLLIETAGHYAECVTNSQAALQRIKEENFQAILLDLNLGTENGLEVIPLIQKSKPNLPIVMFTAQGSVKTAVEAMRLGAVDFLEKPFNREQFITVVARLQRIQKMGEQIEQLQEEVKESKSQSPTALFDFTAPVMKEVMEVLGRAASTPTSILILGESGTGKSVLAREIHQMSNLANKPFVTVSCPSLSKELLESDLFGHIRGAFTGAVKDHWGKVKAASGGTLFLDEIGDLPLEIQPKLLRLLQEREYERLGENVTRQADVRIIAATNKDLKKKVEEGTFREDLFFRLNVITVDMPPLRTRRGDTIRFANHYLQHFASQFKRKIKGFSEEAQKCIQDYEWPGNLRELRNAIERASILAKKEEVTTSDLPAETQGLISSSASTGSTTSSGGAPQAGALMTLEQLEEAHIRRILEKISSLTEAAEVLGIDQATLYRKRKKLGLE
ncbi:MAG: sigma-54 dependent transcriptional regulator [Verrucomicrobiota bacterium]